MHHSVMQKIKEQHSKIRPLFQFLTTWYQGHLIQFIYGKNEFSLSLYIQFCHFPDRLMQKPSFHHTTTKLMFPTNGIWHVIRKLRIFAFEWCTICLVWWVLWSITCSKSGKSTPCWFFAWVPRHHMDFYEGLTHNLFPILQTFNIPIPLLSHLWTVFWSLLQEKE